LTESIKKPYKYLGKQEQKKGTKRGKKGKRGEEILKKIF
jgi:hypothetical protein